jgi:hypothetical protein
MTWRKAEMQSSSSVLNGVWIRAVGSGVDGVASSSFRDEKSARVVMYITDNGECDEKAKETDKDENEDTDVQNATGVENGGSLVGRIGLVENIIFIRSIIV